MAHPRSSEPDDISRIAADDAFLTALGNPDRSTVGEGHLWSRPGLVDQQPGRAEIGPLFTAWRAELLDPPFPPVPTAGRAVGRGARGSHRSQRSAVRPVVAVAAAICGLLLGSAAVSAKTALPGDALWPLTQVLWADHADSVEAKVAARSSLDTARSALLSGDAPKALAALTSASMNLNKVNPDDSPDLLKMDLALLMQQANSTSTETPADRGSSTGSQATVIVTRNGRTVFVTTGPPATAGVPPTSAAHGGGQSDRPGDAVSDTPIVPAAPPFFPIPQTYRLPDAVLTTDPLVAPTSSSVLVVPPVTGLTPTIDPATSAPISTDQPTTSAPPTDPPTTSAQPTDPPTDPPTTSAPPTDPPTTDPPTDPPPSDPPTSAPVTDPPTSAPVTDPPTSAPGTDPPITDIVTAGPVAPEPLTSGSASPLAVDPATISPAVPPLGLGNASAGAGSSLTTGSTAGLPGDPVIPSPAF